MAPVIPSPKVTTIGGRPSGTLLRKVKKVTINTIRNGVKIDRSSHFSSSYEEEYKVTLIKKRMKMTMKRTTSPVYLSITLIERLSKSRFKKMTVYTGAKLDTR